MFVYNSVEHTILFINTCLHDKCIQTCIYNLQLISSSVVFLIANYNFEHWIIFFIFVNQLLAETINCILQ